MLLSKLGEFGLIERFKKLIKTDSAVIEGLGDDCAVLRFDKDNYQLFTCDMLVEGVDFLSCDDPYLFGRKAIAVSISDIAACGGAPRHCLISLGIPGKTSVEFIDKLFKGMRDLAKKYGINIVGGDLSKSRALTIDVSMLGMVKAKNLVLRSGAKRDDLIFVTGALGSSLKSGHHLDFTPKIKESQYLVKNFTPRAMIDISDGLCADLGHILEKSQKGAILYEELIPKNKDASLSDALYSGEDFELLFTLPLKAARRLIAARKPRGMQFFLIGRIVDYPGIALVDKHYRHREIKIKGFRHF